MGPIRTLILAAAMAASAPGQAENVAQWRAEIAEAAERFDLPVRWIEAVMHSESAGRTHLGGQPIRSSAGAMGLMQLMPGTWRDMRARLGLGHDPDDPRDNILAGTFYLRLMYDRFGYPGLFAAYNAGPARYLAHLAGRRTLPAETIAYVAKVAPATAKPKVIPGPTTQRNAIFVIAKASGDIDLDNAVAGPATSLFAPLSRRD